MSTRRPADETEWGKRRERHVKERDEAMSNHHETIYLRGRRPCWLCSKQLMRAQSGEHRGKYAAVEVEIDGYRRLLHVQCFRDRQAEEAPQTPPDPRTDWLIKGRATR